MKKTSSITIFALLALSAFLLIIPAPRAIGSTGQLHLAYVNSVPSPTSGTTGSVSPLVNESVPAGSGSVVKAGYANLTNAARNDLFALDFDTVTFSGTQFNLFISTDGFSQINTTAGETQDLKYGPLFNTADFSANPMKNLGGGYYIGTNGTHKMVVGPIPINISSSYNFIKVFDGNSGAVAVSHEKLVVVPGLSLSPTEGIAGTVVKATGGGFPSSKTIDLTYSFSWTYFSNGTAKAKSGNWSTGISTGPGYFSTTPAAGMVNVNQQILDATFNNLSRVAVTISGVLEPTPHTVYASAVFQEDSAFVNGVVSLDSSGSVIDNTDHFTPWVAFGSDNGTGFTNCFGTSGLPANVCTPLIDPTGVALGSLVISGNWSAANSDVTITVDGKLNAAHTAVTGATTIGTATADASGFYNTTASLPVLSLGLHLVTVNQGGTLYWFMVNIIPSITLSPSTGPIGTTVTITAYGFPANNLVWVFWEEYSWGDGNAYNLVNGTTGSNGSFSGTVTFSVPDSYGVLPHSVYAVANSSGYTFIGTDTWANILAIPPTAMANFTVTSTLSVNATVNNDGSPIVAVATGLVPGCSSDGFENALGKDCEDLQSQLINNGTPSNMFYALSLDNAPLVTDLVNVGSAYGGAMATGKGDMVFSFPAAGLRPGLHDVAMGTGYSGHQLLNICSQFTNECIASGTYAPTLVALFTVTTNGDPIGDQLTALTTTISGLSSSLSSIQSSLTNIQSSLTTITSDVSGLGSQLTSIQGSLATITSDVSGLGAQLTSIQGSLTTLSSSVSSISTTLNTAAASAQTAATQATAAATAATNAVNGNSTSQTYVLVVAVLAAITLVLELAILVRKLS